MTTMPGRPSEAELGAVVAFIAAQQARPDRRITYVGTDATGITAELGGLEPDWATTVRIVRADGDIAGAVVVEWDDELGRSWILGPWVAGDGDAWAATADELVDAALVQLPPEVTRHEMSGDVANHRLASLAAGRGWAATEPIHILVLDAGTVTTWPGAADDRGAALRSPVDADLPAIAALHDVEFPDTFASARQLLDGARDGSRVVLVADGGRGEVVGYVAGEVHEDGEGFIDFVAVGPAGRGKGVGRQLVMAATRLLLDRSPLGQVGLTVQDHRLPARRLYGQLGFRSEGTVLAYRSWTAPPTP